MKLLCINPNTSLSMTEDIKLSAEKARQSTTEITYVNPQYGPESIETYLDEFMVAIGVLELITKERDNYDGFIIACGDDPGLFAAREITDKPVVAIGQAPMLFAPMLGRKFTILGTWKGDETRSLDKVAKYGLSDLVASVKPSGATVLGSHCDHAGLIDRLEVIARKAIEEDGAEVFMTTCAGMAGVHEELSKRLGVPVLEGVTCAVKLVEDMVEMGVKTTRVGQYTLLPETKNLKGFEGFRDLYWVKK